MQKFDALNPAPHADHQGHRMNLSGIHQGNRYCLACEVPVGEPVQISEEEASAAVPVAAVVNGRDNMVNFRERMVLRAYLTRAKHGMHLTSSFKPTIRMFNEAYGQSCKTWDAVAIVAERLMKEGEGE